MYEYNLANGNHMRINGQVINKKFVENVSVIICAPPTVGRRPNPATQAERQPLINFYNDIYRHDIPGIEERPSLCNLSTVIRYEAVVVITDYSNNIIQNYESYVERLVECYLHKIEHFEWIKNNNQMNATQKENARINFNRRTKLIVRDVICLQKVADANGNMVYNYQSGESRVRLDEMKSMAVPPKAAFHQNSVLLDVEQFPFDYFHSMLEMMIHIESWGLRVANVFPLKSSEIPGHYLFDTTTIVKILYPNDIESDYVIGERTEYTKRSAVVQGNYMSDNKDLLWNLFFQTRKHNHRIFHGKRLLDNIDEDDDNDGYIDNHGFTFHHQIRTDGKSCSVLLVRKHAVGTHKPQSPKMVPIVEPYIDEITPAQRLVYQTKRLACIDPNMEDLLSSVEMERQVYNDQQADRRLAAIKLQKRWRYTQSQRRFETKSKVRSKALLREKRSNFDIFGVSIQAREAQLSLHSKKSLTFAAFREYCWNKNRLNNFVRPFYQQMRHRSRRFEAFSRRQKSESKMILSFKKKHGGPKTTIVVIGDWAQRYQRRHHAPVKGVGFRKLFRKAGYHFLLVDEYKTSKQCCICQNFNAICKTFRWVRNPKRKSRHNMPWIKCHGLVRCTTCSRLYNRDPNSATNQWIISNAAINGEDRPLYVRRGVNG